MKADEIDVEAETAVAVAEMPPLILPDIEEPPPRCDHNTRNNDIIKHSDWGIRVPL